MPPPRSVGATSDAIPDAVREGRRRLREGDVAGARRALGEDRGLRVEEPERSWTLAALWSAECDAGRARAAAAALPDGPFARALRAVFDERPDAAIDALRSEVRRGGDEWTRLALAWIHLRAGDADAALANARRAGETANAFVAAEAGLIRLRVHLSRRALGEAARETARLDAFDPQDARPHAIAANAARRRGDDVGAIRANAEALLRAPRSPRYAEAIASVLEWTSDDAAWGAAREAGRRLAGSHGRSRNAEWPTVEGLLAEHDGDDARAEALFRDALARGATPVLPERRLRVLLARRGDHAASLALLVRSLPPGLLSTPRNVLADRWRALEGAVAAAPTGAADPRARYALARAFLDVGALPEALAIASRIPGPEASTFAEGVRREVAFEEAIRALVEDGYRANAREEDPEPFEDVLVRVGDLARRRLLPADAAAIGDASRGRKALPMIGAWLDHGATTTAPLVAHFRRFGKYLVFGQREGQPTEAVLLSLADLEPRRPMRTRGGVHPHDLAVGHDRSLRAFVDFTGGDLGGACLADGLWIDSDTARRDEHDVRAAVSLRADRPSVSPLLPADTFDGPLAVTDPACVSARLLARYVARRPNDSWGSYRTLVAHESAHVADIARYFPGRPNIAAALALFAEEGFSPAEVERELERRAQLAAIAESSEPDLALAELLRPLPVYERDPESHDGGYARGARDLVEEVARRPDLQTGIDLSARILPQLDRLSDDAIRRAAAAALARGRSGRSRPGGASPPR